MAGITFDDLVPSANKAGSISFDDLVPSKSNKNMNPADIIVPQAGGGARAAAYGFSAGMIPFANRITSAMAAGAVSPFVDETYSQLYRQAMADTRATQEANPGMTTLGNVAGAVSTLPAAFSKTPQVTGALSGAGRGLKYVTDTAGKLATARPFKGSGVAAGAGNLAAKMVGGAAVAAPVTGAYFAGEAQPGEMGEQFMQGAKLGGTLGAALPVAGAVVGGLGGAAIKGAKNIKAGIGARGADELDDAAMAIKDVATQQYAKMRQAGAVFSPNATQNIQAKISQTLAQDGALNPRLHDKVLAVYDDISQGLSKGAVGLDELDQWRQVLGDIAGNFSDKVNARKATIMIKSIDDLVENVQPTDLISGGKQAVDALKAGREAWARQSRFRAVADIVKNSGNDVNKLKRDLTKMLLNPKKTRGFSKQEMDALKEAARQTTGEGIMKMVGKFGFDIGSGSATGNTGLPVITGTLTGLGSLATGGTGGIGVAIPAVGTVARSTQKALGFGKAENLLKLIEQGGQVTGKMVSELPQAEKNKFLKYVAGLPAAQATAIMNGTKDKVQ